MNEDLDERYFDWLYSLVCSVKAKKRTGSYRTLLQLLYRVEFVWFVPNDDNRIEDGKDLRHLFLEQEGIEISHDEELWLELGCSMFELLVGLARRLEFEAGGYLDDWFWEMLTNLGLDGLDDRKDIEDADVEDVLNRVIWRTYNRDGSGGLFPLRSPKRDQRKVELWYQLSSYILERD